MGGQPEGHPRPRSILREEEDGMRSSFPLFFLFFPSPMDLVAVSPLWPMLAVATLSATDPLDREIKDPLVDGKEEAPVDVKEKKDFFLIITFIFKNGLISHA